jgi:hypothetical protein
VRTRGDVATKQGKIGDKVPLIANYFSFKTKADFTVFKYRLVYPIEILVLC